MAEEQKPGGFGSLPGDLFEEMIIHFGTTPPMSAALEPSRLPILMQLARTEHAAANAVRDPYAVDIVFKCISLKDDFLIVKAAALPDPVLAQAMNRILTTLQALKLLWVP